MLPCVVSETLVVVTLNVPVVDPAGIVMLVGTNAGEPLVHSWITSPPVGAAALRVSVPVADVPPLMLLGMTEIEERATAGVTVIVVFVLLPS
jgi:hypothetical protein